METERIHHLTEQEYLVQRACFMHNDASFSKRSCFDPEPEDLFDNVSTSEAVMGTVQEYVKRSVIDRKSMPFKKRKQLHEELDYCDVFFDHFMQKSDIDEGINEIVEKENNGEPTPNTSQKAPIESQIEFNLQSSVFVKVDDSMEWIRLKCFESTIIEEPKCATFFAGGPIQSSAFFVTSHMEVNQYIALSVSNAISNKHSYNDTSTGNGLIQLWNLGSQLEGESLKHRPSMELALYHDIGVITEMKWCPADCYDKYPATGHLPRLGLLATSSLDSCVYIYSIPQPDFMPKLKLTFPIYFTQPSWKLTPLFGGPSNTTRKSVATCIDWEKNGKQIIAGYGNGAVCVWMIKISSFTSHIGVKREDQSYIIQPYLFFQSSGTPVKSLSFAPFNNLRWLVVLSVDGYVRFFDLLDTSAPFKIIKQGVENCCMWGDVFCGVYSSPIINHFGVISLSATDCNFEHTRDQQGSGIETNQKKGQKFARAVHKAGIFDSSANVAVSGNRIIHAIANMAGAVTVNFLKKLWKPFETEYFTYYYSSEEKDTSSDKMLLLETEFIALHNVDLELKDLQSKINISGNVQSNEISLAHDTKGSLHAEKKQESSVSSSSSGFCSPNHDKTIIIETDQCFASDAIHLLKSPPKSSPVNDFMDNNNNRINEIPNRLLNCEETNGEIIKCSDFSEDLMRDLLMLKVLRQSKSSSPTFPLNGSNNSAIYCDSNYAKQISGEDFIAYPARSDYTGDTIVYPVEDYYCDTSHSNALKSVKSNKQSESLDLKKKKNMSCENTVHKLNRKSALKHQIFSKNSLNFSSSELKSGNSFSNDNSSSNTRSEFNYKNMNLKKTDNYSSAHFISFNCNNLKGKKYDSKKSKEIMKNECTFLQNLDTKSDLISKKDAKNLLLQKHCDALKPSNSNHPTSRENMYSDTTSNDSIMCDIDDKKLSAIALNQSSAASDYSGDTIIYSLEAWDYNDVKYLNSKKPSAISQSLCIKEQENTFQDISLPKIQEEAVLHESKTKLLTENSCSSNGVLTETLLKCHSAFETETDSATECCNLNDKDEKIDHKDILISNFHLLHSEYLNDKSEEKPTVLKERQQSGKKPQKLSYENLISSYGVMFKNNLKKFTKPLKNQEHDICVEYNPLSVIKTISWNPNKGCHSWLFVGGNSGVGRLVFVPKFSDDKKRNPQCINKK